jgi:16S rRNA C967 or C1407 C5-methylase (RsmB/RsmF family)
MIRISFFTIQVTNHDAAEHRTTDGLYRLAPFDKILVDAPCSTDRHLLRSDLELAKWTAGEEIM